MISPRQALVMFKDADHSYFVGDYIVYSYTNLHFGINSQAAITERKFHMHMFIELIRETDPYYFKDCSKSFLIKLPVQALSKERIPVNKQRHIMVSYNAPEYL